MSYVVYANLFYSDTTSNDETDAKKSKTYVVLETLPASTPTTSTGKVGRRKSPPSTLALMRKRFFTWRVCRPTFCTSRDLYCNLLVDLEEQCEAVKRQKVADLLKQRRREREAASKKASTSDEVKTPPTYPTSQVCIA